MSKTKPEPPKDDPAESQRFIDAARELGVDESPEAFDRAFKKVVNAPINPGSPSGLDSDQTSAKP